MNQKNTNFFSRQDYDKVLRRNGLFNSLNGAKTAINHLDKFCKATYQKGMNDVLTEISESMHNNPKDVTSMIFLTKLVKLRQQLEDVQNRIIHVKTKPEIFDMTELTNIEK